MKLTSSMAGHGVSFTEWCHWHEGSTYSEIFTSEEGSLIWWPLTLTLTLDHNNAVTWLTAWLEPGLKWPLAFSRPGSSVCVGSGSPQRRHVTCVMLHNIDQMRGVWHPAWQNNDLEENHPIPPVDGQDGGAFWDAVCQLIHHYLPPVCY